MRKALTFTLVDLARTDPRVVLMTADLGFMVLEDFANTYPDRFFNVGVAEANMIGLATGLAASGFIPYVYSIGTFASMRAYEQIRNGPVFHNLKVRIVGVGGGFEYGHGGFTHHALEDLGIMRIQPTLKVIAPADPKQAENAVRDAHDLDGPIYFRLGKRDDYEIPGLAGRFRAGRTEIIRRGSDVLIISIGSVTVEVAKAADALAAKGVESTVAVVSSLRPAPEQDLVELLSEFKVAVAVEEHYPEGGLGSLVAEIIAERGVSCRVVRCNVGREPVVLGGGESYLRSQCGLTADGLTKRILASLGK